MIFELRNPGQILSFCHLQHLFLSLISIKSINPFVDFLNLFYCPCQFLLVFDNFLFSVLIVAEFIVQSGDSLFKCLHLLFQLVVKPLKHGNSVFIYFMITFFYLRSNYFGLFEILFLLFKFLLQFILISAGLLTFLLLYFFFKILDGFLNPLIFCLQFFLSFFSLFHSLGNILALFLHPRNLFLTLLFLFLHFNNLLFQLFFLRMMLMEKIFQIIIFSPQIVIFSRKLIVLITKGIADAQS